jgi:hypothetical protein
MTMKIKEEDKDLNYWKENCKEDYLHTPISVLRYITKLEEAVNNGVLDDVIVIHLKALTKKIEDSHSYGFDDVLQDYLDSL